MIPGEYRFGQTPLPDEDWRAQLTLVMVNTGDRPIQIGSHLHLPEANSALHFDREATVGYHLDIQAGTSIRFEPGVSKNVACTRFGGRVGQESTR
ncbi:urease subunit beta [Nocardia camponoti]|uniref:Urease subunit beta n=1 Tax=Nocardia camponoti TaxID=1616106 RepID=A0A917Q908_9NOCA|nr:urease subunit beta [Nocardia camponoti]GGK37488.1 urease subunit beta [Nocardia camponoti]